MKDIVFLASANAQKPEILIRTYYESANPFTEKGILLTNSNRGNVIDMAEELGMKIMVCPDSKFSDNAWIEENLNEFKDCILVSCGWPYMIPPNVIRSFFAALNCHGSYLPDYRGSRAYMHYWANFSPFYGATIHYINEKFDDGNILVRGKLKRFEDESHDAIFIRTAELCGHLLVAGIAMAENREEGFTVNEQKRYFFKLSPEEFEAYYQKNRKKIEKSDEVILTPHKII